MTRQKIPWWCQQTFENKKVCWHYLAMFCLVTSSKLSRQWFEFTLNVMGSNPGYLLKSFLLYLGKFQSYKIIFKEISSLFTSCFPSILFLIFFKKIKKSLVLGWLWRTIELSSHKIQTWGISIQNLWNHLLGCRMRK